MENDKKYYSDYLELLEKVSYNRKKDGTIFANINKNFTNGKVVVKSYNDSNHPSFQVSGIVSSNHSFQVYDFDAYLYTDDMRRNNPNDERLKKMQDISGWARNTYFLTVPEIEEKIEEQKEFCKKNIENYENQIERLEEIYDKFHDKILDLKDFILNSCYDLRENKLFCTSLEYALQDVVSNKI